jgi:hypothetical protein
MFYGVCVVHQDNEDEKTFPGFFEKILAAPQGVLRIILFCRKHIFKEYDAPLVRQFSPPVGDRKQCDNMNQVAGNTPSPQRGDAEAAGAKPPGASERSG